jgi:hypothetical protein
MKKYTVKYGETIADVVLNSTGSLEKWTEVLDLNNFTTWTPVLFAGQILNVPEPFEVHIYNELSFYPACNNTEITDLELKISTLKIALDSIAAINHYEFPVIENNGILIYIVKEGETITDVVLNSTGSIDNWQTILDLNGFTEWTPTLKAGDPVIIGYVNFQRNVWEDLQINPACNRPEIINLQEKINQVIGLLTSNWILANGIWNDSGIWIDSAKWID